MLSAIPVLAVNIEHSDRAAPGDRRRRSWPATPTGPGARWKSTATTPPRCCAACSADERRRRTAMTRNDRHLDVDELTARIERRRDRHRGRRLHRHAGPAAGQAAARALLPRRVLGHGTEGCNYLLAVDVDMNTVDGYAMSSWEQRLRRHGVRARPRHDPACCRTCPAPRWCSATWSGSTARAGRAVAAHDPAGAGRAGRRRSATSRWPAPSWSSSSSTTPTRRPGRRTTAT